MNSVDIPGRLTTDPELRSLPSGEAVCKLRLAVEGLAAGRETGYLNVSCFGSGGQAAARVLSKGWLVAVSGRLAYRAWETEFLAAPRGNGATTPGKPEEAVAS